MSQGYKETRLSSRETDGLHSRPSSTMDLSVTCASHFTCSLFCYSGYPYWIHEVFSNKDAM